MCVLTKKDFERESARVSGSGVKGERNSLKQTLLGAESNVGLELKP